MNEKISEIQTPFAAFDFDGTIADSNFAYIEFARQYYKDNGSVLTQETIDRAITMSTKEIAFEMGIELGVPGEKVLLDTQQYIGNFYANLVQPKPGVCDYVRSLKNKGVRMCVVSSSDKRCIEIGLKRFGIFDCFERIVTPADTGGISKSKPQMFEKAIDLFGKSSNDIQITLYDDSLEALKTAAAVGYKTVCVFDRAGAAFFEEAKKVCTLAIETFNELVRGD